MVRLPEFRAAQAVTGCVIGVPGVVLGLPIIQMGFDCITWL